ncbi:MAG: ABC transporter permease [Vampirovibrionia bacterium]
MNILSTVIKNFKQHKLSTGLTIVSIALGISLVVAVCNIKDQIKDHFFNISSKYELILGAKGSPLQLVLNSMYFMGAPTGNIKYSYFDSLKESPLIQMMIPYSLGDHYKESLIVGTSDDFFLPHNSLVSKPLSFKEGKKFDTTMQIVAGSKAAEKYKLKAGAKLIAAHGVMESAEEHSHKSMPYTISGILNPTNTPIDNTLFTDIRSVWEIHEHHHKEHKHHKGETKEHKEHKQHGNENESKHIHTKNLANENHITPEEMLNEGMIEELVKDTEQIQKDQMRTKYAPITYDNVEGKQITSVLIKLASPAYLLQIQREINEDTEYQAANPAYEIQKLISLIGNIDNLLLIISFMVIIVAVISILITTYNSIINRKREIAILRAIGASKQWIISSIVIEITIICLISWVAGIILGHLLLTFISPLINNYADIYINNLQFTREELTLLPVIIILGLLSSLLPAYEAYKTDVANNLISKQ